MDGYCTCRARKLGCDGKLPTCTQCLLTGQNCAGYQYDLIFKFHQHSSKRKPPRKKAFESSSNVDGQQAMKLIPAMRKLGSTETEVTIMQKMLHPSMPAKRFPLEACSALIICKYAPWLQRSSMHFILGTDPFQVCSSWVGVLPKLLDGGGIDSILSSAMCTLGISIRCKDTPPRPPVSAYPQAYGLALNHLRKGLLQTDRSLGAELIAASMCLSIAEVFHGPQENHSSIEFVANGNYSQLMLPTCQEGWTAHLKGIGKILQLHGPGRYSAGVSYQLFMGIRPLLLYESFHSRTSSFLAMDEWQTVPYTVYPPLALHYLLNHAAIIPPLLERFDTLMKSPTHLNPQTAKDIWLDFGRALAILHNWELLYRLDTKEPCYWSKPTRSMNLHPSVMNSSSEEIFWFPNVLVAIAFTHLWAFRIICLIHREQLQSWFPDLARRRLPTESESSAQPSYPSVFELSTWVLKSMEYLIQDEMKLHGPLCTLFPFTTSYEAFRLDTSQNTQPLDWCQRIANQLVIKGFGLANHFV